MIFGNFYKKDNTKKDEKLAPYTKQSSLICFLNKTHQTSPQKLFRSINFSIQLAGAW